MHIGVYGSGYLGTIISACLADFGVPVTCFDGNLARLNQIASGNVPFFEKNLSDIVRRNVRAGRLVFSSDLASMVRRAEVLYLAEDSAYEVDERSLEIAALAEEHQFLVLVTPVAVGVASRIEAKLRLVGSKMNVVSHPVFLTPGCAVEDFNWPDRILLGTTSLDAIQKLKELYRPLVMRGVPVIVTNHETAELVREATTAFVATKISFINEIASLCEHVQADAMDLSLALGLDKKIAPRCLQPGSDIGGAFVEAEMESLARLASKNGVPLKVLSAAREVNRSLNDRVLEKMTAALDTLPGKQVGVLGLSFKPHTNSVASSGSIALIKKLVTAGAQVRAYDPVAIPEARVELSNTVQYCDSPYKTAEGVDALVMSTAWPEFRGLDFDRIRRTLRRPVIMDTKNMLDAVRMRSMGFQYLSIGRGA